MKKYSLELVKHFRAFQCPSPSHNAISSIGKHSVFLPVVYELGVRLFPCYWERKFIIVAVDYFTKWVEAELLSKIVEKDVIGFRWKNILGWFGIPRVLVSDNDTQFSG